MKRIKLLSLIMVLILSVSLCFGLGRPNQPVTASNATVLHKITVGDSIVVNGTTINATNSGSDPVFETFNYINITQPDTADTIYGNFVPDLSLDTGTVVFFIADSSVHGPTVFIVDSDTSAIKEAHDGSALESNDIKLGMPVMLMFNGADWIQFSQSGN